MAQSEEAAENEAKIQFHSYRNSNIPVEVQNPGTEPIARA